MAVADILTVMYTMTYSFIAYALPAYLTYKALAHKGDVDVRNWAVYWTILAVVSCCHRALDCVLCWLPFYYLLKLGFLLALWHPNTQLALWLYDRSVGPLLGSWEADIDSLWRDAWTAAVDTAQHQALAAKASLQRISGKASVMLSQAMHAQQSKLQQQQRTSGPGSPSTPVGAYATPGGASYAGSSAAGGMGGMATAAKSGGPSQSSS
ncbi:hypothetical protein OEZ86_012601 [Tetradesmus obliquus]|nr:hypothetical protein OEZ86_012601 [Tetradesmus obliquus]